MALQQNDDECPSKKSWGQILNGWAKKLVWKSADGLGEEAGRSFGKLLFWAALALAVLWLGSAAINTFTDFFGGWFDWVPNPFSWWTGTETPPVAETTTPPIEAPAEESACTMWGRNVPAWLTRCK